jgi:hypothetical protein
VTFDEVKKLAAWPGVEESTSYGTRALKVSGKLIARLKEDGDTLVVFGVELDEKDALIAAQPRIYTTTPHYNGHRSVLVRLSKAKPAHVESHLLRRWREVAPKQLVRAFDAGA